MKMLPVLVILLCCFSLHQAAILHCDFESDCNDFVIDDYWGYTDGAHPQTIDHDHTFNNKSGHYRYYDPQGGSRFDVSEIKTNGWLPPSMNGTLCFRMWYWTNRIIMPFTIQIIQGDDEQLAYVLVSIVGKDPSTNDWALINVTLPNERMKIYIRINATGTPLAFDDLSVDYCNGPAPSPPKRLYACDFESSCTDDFVSLPLYPDQWSILNASDAVKIVSSAPSVDYTFGNQSGHYALLPHLGRGQIGNVGYLHLQEEIRIGDEESYCLNFQYYGFGSLYGLTHLEIYSWTFDEMKTIQMIWPVKGSSQYPYTNGNWTWGVTNLPTGNYTLLFRTATTDTSLKTYALDNIDISSCGYPSSQPSPYSYLLSFSCDFDHSNMCEMMNEEPQSKSEYNFTLLTGDTLPDPRQLGPARDHTSNSTSGGFLYWDRQLPFTGRDIGRVFISKSIEKNTGMCLKMAYFVNSTAVNKNATSLYVSMGGCEAQFLWILSLDNSQGWQTVIIPVSGVPCGTNFYFDVGQSGSIPVSVALDDIVVDQCSSFIPTTTTSTTTIPTTATITTTTTTTTLTTMITTEPITSNSSSTETTEPVTSNRSSTETTEPVTSNRSSTETTEPVTSNSSSTEMTSTTRTSSTVPTTPSHASQLFSINRYDLMIFYFLSIVVRNYVF